jgi:hypothetical protein
MSETLEAAPTTRRARPDLVAVLVAVAVVVGWVLYRHYLYPHLLERALRREVIIDRFWLVNLVQAMLLCLPYALALLLWGRGLGRGAGAAAVAVGTGLFMWGWNQVFSRYVWDSLPPSHTSVRVFTWGYLLVVATLVPLAWGVARRRGRAWVGGLLVAPVVAAALRELGLRWDWWQARVDQHWQLQAVVYVAPFVLAALACWALDHGPIDPETGSSPASTEAQPRRSRG